MSLIKGDVVETLKTLETASIDLIFADPPYNLQLSDTKLYRPDQTLFDGTRDDWDSFPDQESYLKFCESWLAECQRVLKPTGSIWVIGSYHNIFLIGYLMQKLGFWLLNDVVWVKSNPTPNFKGTRFCNAHETLIWAAKNKSGKPYFDYHAMKSLNGDKQMRSDWELPICSGKERLKKDGKKAHSTQKPEALLYRVILSSSKKDDLVLDPFLGTGTTGAVAKKLHRRFVGIDNSAEYIDLAKQRIASVQHLGLVEVMVERPKERKVPFPKLLELGLINPGDYLFFGEKKQVAALVMADGSLMAGDARGSIHQVGKALSDGAPCNGWENWYFLKGKEFHALNEKRIAARKIMEDQKQ